jgi:hypothetical protein
MLQDSSQSRRNRQGDDRGGAAIGITSHTVALRGSLPTLRAVALLTIAEEPILDFAVDSVKPLFRLERLLLHLLHLLLQFLSTIFGGPKLHRELMRRLSGVLIICLSRRGRLLKQRDDCRP